MGTPCTLQVPLSVEGYCLILDTAKKQCEESQAHWHLYKDEVKIGQISWDARWQEKPTTIDESVIKDAEEKTRKYSKDIRERYFYNRKFGYGA